MKFKFTWGHGVILALVCFVIFICTMVFSIEFSKNSFDLVSDNYYEEEINYQQEIDAAKNASELPERPEIEISKRGIEIFFPKEFNSQNTAGNFRLIRANSKELDINKKTLDFSSKNSVFIPFAVLKPGNYTLKLYWNKDEKGYLLEKEIVWK